MFEFLSFRHRLQGFSLIKGDSGTTAIIQGTVVDHCVEGGVELDSPLNMSYEMGYLQTEKPEPIPERA